MENNLSGTPETNAIVQINYLVKLFLKWCYNRNGKRGLSMIEFAFHNTFFVWNVPGVCSTFYNIECLKLFLKDKNKCS